MNAVTISWLPPRRPNGLLTQYTVYIRILDQGQEMKITKSTLPAQNLHHEVTSLKLHETYEAWVTAATKVGQGSSTPVIKLQPSTAGKTRTLSRGFPRVVVCNISPLRLLLRPGLKLYRVSRECFDQTFHFSQVREVGGI